MTLSLLKTGGNALSILSSDVMNRATSFILYALVARHLGANEFGQLMVALTLFYTFQVFAVGGLKTLIIRQVAKDRTQTAAYFVNGCAIVMVSSLCSVLQDSSPAWFPEGRRSFCARGRKSPTACARTR